MADSTLSALTEATSVADDDLLYLVKSGLDRKLKAKNLANLNPLSGEGIRLDQCNLINISHKGNRNEGTYGVAQTFGSCVFNPDDSRWYIIANTGISVILYSSEDGKDWDVGRLLWQDPAGILCVAFGIDITESTGFWAIVATGSPATFTIKNSDDLITWVDTPLTFEYTSGVKPTEYSGMCNTGDGRMITLWTHDTNDKTGVAIFDPVAVQASPLVSPTIVSVAVEDWPIDAGLFYDSESGSVVAMLDTIDGEVVQFMIVDDWGTPTVTKVDVSSKIPTVLVRGTAWGITRLGDKFYATTTARSVGKEYIAIADVTAALAGTASAWNLYEIGTSGSSIGSGHVINGTGGIVGNYEGDDNLLVRTFSVGNGIERESGDLYALTIDFELEVISPLITTGKIQALRTRTQPTQILVDNEVVSLASAKIPVSPNTRYICEGRAIIILPADATVTDTIEIFKSAEEFKIVRQSGDIFIQPDFTTLSSGTSWDDTSDKPKHYILTCIDTQTWRIQCFHTTFEGLLSQSVFTASIFRTDLLFPRLDLYSGRNWFFRREDFTRGNGTSGTIGENNWVSNTSGGGSILASDTIFDHPGVVKITTNAALNAKRDLTESDTWWRRNLGGAPFTKYHVEWVFYLPSIDDIKFFIGCERTEGSHIFGIILDRGTSSIDATTPGTDFRSVTHNGAAYGTPQVVGAAIAATWFRLQIYESTNGSMVFLLYRLDTGALVGTTTHTTNLTTSDLRMIMRVESLAVAAKAAWADYNSILIWDLAR